MLTQLTYLGTSNKTFFLTFYFWRYCTLKGNLNEHLCTHYLDSTITTFTNFFSYRSHTVFPWIWDFDTIYFIMGFCMIQMQIQIWKLLFKGPDLCVLSQSYWGWHINSSVIMYCIPNLVSCDDIDCYIEEIQWQYE